VSGSLHLQILPNRNLVLMNWFSVAALHDNDVSIHLKPCDEDRGGFAVWR
jgi:hypothetical protein